MDQYKKSQDISSKLEKYKTNHEPKLKNTMSVPEMHRLLGVKKDRELLTCPQKLF